MLKNLNNTPTIRMSKSIDNLKYFLKEMFQFNENDLDFGIYKIYNLKRKHIESFIDGDGENDLTPTIETILKEVNLENQKTDAIELEIFLKGLNQDKLLEDPEANYKQLELFIGTEQSEDKKAKLTETLNNLSKSEGLTDELKDKIYNHILGFFQMYYSNGDFGYNDRSRDLYKVPYEADYNGSDTMFHWKHKGSLYIKTGASFNAIKFDLNGKKIEYRLETNVHSEDEGTSHNNNKDSQLKHYRFDRIEKVKDKTTNEEVYQVIFNLSDASTSKVAIYKAIFKEVFSETNIDKYLEYTKDDKTKQVFVDLTKDFDKVQNGAIKGLSALRQTKAKVEKEVKNNFERGVRLYDEETKKFTDETLKALYTLDQKLNSFYIGNDADYFIHENLNEFLTNEKNRYVKNYIFDDLESIYSGKLDNTTLLIAKAFDKVSSRIIEFLSAIEDFQKHLFTKKKKVIESEYCITVDYINEQYYPEILANKTQLQEWENLFSLEVKTIDEIKANPTLVLDTKCFKQANGTNPFKDKILAEIDDLDENTNGLLINSENYQSINILQNKYRKHIDGIYIDPPYNTDASSIIYKNNFKDSSWLSLMENRLSKSKSLLNISEGMICVAIDDEEVSEIRLLLSSIFEKKVGIVAVRSNPAGRKTKGRFSPAHEYALFYGVNENAIPGSLELTEKRLERYPNEDDNGRFAWANFIRSGTGDKREDRPKSFYPLYVGENDKIRIPKLKWNDNENSYDILEEPKKGESVVYPILKDDGKLIEKRWQRGHKRVPTELDEYRVRRLENGDISIDFKTRMDENSLPITWWDKKAYASANYGALELKKLFGVKGFDFPKSKELVKDCLRALSGNKESGIYLDYFSGSATTGHAIIELNKSDKGRRKYILAEMGTYFNKVTKPRIQKVVFSDKWDAGKPKNNDGSPKHIFKYQVLEQYEDVLDNLQVYNGELPENLPIRYLYKPEENSLDNTLNLFTPFNNTISYGQPTQQGFIDVVETYNYLQGYFVKSIKTYELHKKYYKVVETTNGVLVIWRDIVIDEDDSKQVIEIASKYENIHTLEVNAEFATLQLDKSNHLKVGDNDIALKIIAKDVFNQ